MNKIDERIELGGKFRVWIGDPCYVIPDILWDSVCEQIYAGTNQEKNQIIKFEPNDLRKPELLQEMVNNCSCKVLEFIQCGTMYGDGVFVGVKGFGYGVDAGCLAIVPDYLIDPEKRKDAERLGQYFEAQGFIGLRTEGEGELVFYDENGSLEIINTGDCE